MRAFYGVTIFFLFVCVYAGSVAWLLIALALSFSLSLTALARFGGVKQRRPAARVRGQRVRARLEQPHQVSRPQLRRPHQRGGAQRVVRLRERAWCPVVLSGVTRQQQPWRKRTRAFKEKKRRRRRRGQRLKQDWAITWFRYDGVDVCGFAVALREGLHQRISRTAPSREHTHIR